MSKLEELIQQYCPDGVEYVPLSSIGTIKRGNGLQKKDFVKAGIGCIHYGQIYTKFGLFTNKTLTYVDKELADHLLHIEKGDLVIACTSENVEDVCKAVAWLGDDSIVTGGHSCILHHNQNPKYIAYFFQTESFQRQKRKYAYGTKVIDIKPDSIGKIEIPLPPLPVQEEIVRILDAFTELQAELQKRKQQYNYYLDNLLNFNNINRGRYQAEVRWMKIGDICDVFTGGEVPMGSIKGNTSFGSFIYPIWGNGKDIYGYATTYQIDKDAVCISSIGANSGAVFFHKAYFTPIIRLKVLIPRNQGISVRYLFYILSFVGFDVKKSSVPNMNSNEVKQKVIPIPSLVEQQRIVSILDRFDTLTTDLTQGLPAEIEKRRQQYEYYRDKLLTFKRKGA